MNKKLAKQLNEQAERVSKAKRKKPVAKPDPTEKRAEAIYAKAVRLAKKAAAKGKYQIGFYVYRHATSRNPVQVGAAEKAVTRLKRDGFRTELRYNDTTIDVSEQGYGNYKIPSCELILEVSW